MRTGRPKQALILTGEERDRRQSLAHRARSQPRLARRARVVLACAEGLDNKTVARTSRMPAVEVHRRKLGRAPRLLIADAGYYSHTNEEGTQALGVKYVSVPNRNTRSAERRQWQKQRWFKRGQKWRTGCEGRISVLKRRHGLTRCRYHGVDGMKRWVGLGVIADNLVNLGRWLVAQP
jgi:hypothetical protein